MYRIANIFLKQNPDVIVTTSDKGNVTVIMDKGDYNKKIKDILQTSSFKQINRDPTLTIQNKANKYITQLNNLNIIDDVTAKCMRTYNSVTPKLYGNPKVHKEGAPLRPIVSSINSPTNSLAKYLAEILSTAYNKDNNYYVKDSFHFAEQVNNLNLPNNYVVVSFDVVNLFGNISKELVTTVIKKKWQDINRTTNISQDLFLELIHFVLDNNYFLYEDQFYLQTFGCAMGSRLSPILSQYIMDYLLDSCISKLNFPLAFIRKFVDDIILSLPENKIDETLNTFNEFDTYIKFTIEKEENGSVPFLDTKVHRKNNTVMLDWYRKNTNSNKFVHYMSNHSLKIKINFIKAMKNRIEKICHKTFLRKNIQTLRQLLIENSYPRTMVDKLLYSSSDHGPPQSGGGIELPASENICKYGVLPNIPGLTNKIKYALKQEPVKIAIKNIKTVGNLYTKLKSKTPKLLCSNVVYKLECKDCNKTYVGQTAQWLKSRIALHKSDITKKLERCALVTHVNQNSHDIDFENVQIVASEPSYKKRLVLEMININKQEDPINRKTDTQNLSGIYTYMLSYPNRNCYYEGPMDE